MILADSLFGGYEILMSVNKFDFWSLVGAGFSSPFTITTNRDLAFD